MCRARSFCIFVCALLPVLLSSCSSGGPKLSKVTGKVFYEGKPATGAIVTLKGMDDDNIKFSPFGVVGDDGTFHLTTFKDGDGAPEGKYHVTVSWTKSEKELDPESDENGEVLMIPAHYTMAGKSGLTAEIRGSSTVLEPFKLTAEEAEAAPPSKTQ